MTKENNSDNKKMFVGYRWRMNIFLWHNFKDLWRENDRIWNEISIFKVIY